MTLKKSVSVIAIAIVLLFQSCKNKRTVEFNQEFNLFRVEDILNSDDTNLIGLLNRVRGSVGKRGPGSKTIWSRKNDYKLGLYISANHVYGLSGWSSRNAEFFDFNSQNLGIFETSQIPPSDGNIKFGSIQSADFPLVHFNISNDATNASILPEQDFYLGVVDNQQTKKEEFPKYPNNLQTNTPLQLYDPDRRTIADQTWSHPIAGEKAIAIGYPQPSSIYPNGAVVYGKILSDEEALSVMEELKAKSDSEGEIAYNPDVEFWIEAQGLAGMSGGGVFNANGQLLGIMVRSSYKINSPKIIRVVKLSYIKAKLLTFYNSLPEKERAKIKPFISGEL